MTAQPQQPSSAGAAVHGVVVVDKPRGPTSFDVVQRVRRALRVQKAGHTGTLDPMATGVLAVCLGEALKVQQYLVEGDKAYEADVAFGVATDTEDAEGREVARADPAALAALTAPAVEAALAPFLGEIEQVPPMYSAVRVAGRRLHHAARAGESVERAPRKVRVDALTLLAFEAARDGLARARVSVRCGKGTYVRTLAADLGRSLGVPAHLAGLRRTAAGPFTIEDAVPLEELLDVARDRPEAAAARVIPLARALAFMPSVPVTEDQARALSHGRAIEVEAPPGGPFLAISAEGAVLAVCAAGPRGAQPIRVLDCGRTR